MRDRFCSSGRAIIERMGDFSHKAITEQTRLGRSPAQTMEDHDEVLGLSQAHDALSYIYEHQDKIGKGIW
jgi:hypothetical protein